MAPPEKSLLYRSTGMFGSSEKSTGVCCCDKWAKLTPYIQGGLGDLNTNFQTRFGLYYMTGVHVASCQWEFKQHIAYVCIGVYITLLTVRGILLDL